MYEYVLTCSDAKNCETDIQNLERIGEAMKRVCEVHADFVSISRIVTSLNRIVRITHEDRHRTVGQTTAISRNCESAPTTQWPISPVPTPRTEHNPETGQQYENSDIQPVTQEAQLPHLLGHQCGSPSFEPGSLMQGFGSDFEPLSLVRALEMDVLEKNWHEPWWEVVVDVPGDTPEFNNMHF